MAKATKKSAKSTAKKTTNGQKARKPNPLHDTLVRLLSRPNGVTIGDISECGFKYSAVAALAIAARHGFKTSVVKKNGELNRYIARRV
jgi:hypothetical protein